MPRTKNNQAASSEAFDAEAYKLRIQKYLFSKYGKNESNLFTHLSVMINGKYVLFSALDILKIAKQITGKSNILPDKSINQEQDGTESQPYILESIAQWLWASSRVENITKGEKVYFSVNNELISIGHDGYASFIASSPKASSSEVNILDYLLGKKSKLFKIANDLLALGDQHYINQLIAHINNPSLESVVESLLPVANLMIQKLNDDFISGKSLLDPSYGKLHKKYVDGTLSIKDSKDDIESGLSSILSVKDQNELRSTLNEDNINRVVDFAGQLALLFTPSLGLSIKPSDMESSLNDCKKHFVPKIVDAVKAMMSGAEDSTMRGVFERGLTSALANPVVKDYDSKLFEEEPKDILNKLISDFKKQQGNADTIKVIMTLRSSDNIRHIRNLLKNKLTGTSVWYFPVMIAALFLSETSRYSTSFIASLSLLDLIEEEARTPDTQEPYSLFNALQNSSQRLGFIDGYGKIYFYNATEIANEVKASPEFGIPTEEMVLRRRSGKRNGLENQKVHIINDYTKANRVKYNVSGYHPMAHGNSFHEVKDMKEEDDFKYLVLPQQKAASLLIQWLCMKLEQKGLQATCSKMFFDDPVALQAMTSIPEVEREDYMQNLLYPLLLARMQNFDNQLRITEPVSIIQESSVLHEEHALSSSSLNDASMSTAEQQSIFRPGFFTQASTCSSRQEDGLSLTISEGLPNANSLDAGNLPQHYGEHLRVKRNIDCRGNETYEFELINRAALTEEQVDRLKLIMREARSHHRGYTESDGLLIRLCLSEKSIAHSLLNLLCDYLTPNVAKQLPGEEVTGEPLSSSETSSSSSLISGMT